jgi:hypothetical protein
MFEWFMARLVVNNTYQKDMCYDEIGLCAPDIDMLLGSFVSTMGRHICSLEEKENLHFGLLQLRHLYSNFES